ncbi:MAG: hypothetical protein E2O39_09940 [Planctomycetota bacterium]|nr:MAG: hypothetical protein E2O39_09940 [Planctomycetota bacterium]
MLSMTPSSGLVGTLLSVALVCGACSDPRPNVLLVTLDTTRPDYMSAYGYEAGHTPNFDAIGNEGARFDMAISASAVTPVSHASILTGRYPYNHGLRVLSAKGGARLPGSESTLATVFKGEGYRTAAVHSAFPVSAIFGFAKDFDVFESFDGLMKEGNKGTSWDMTKLQRRSDHTTDIALDFLADVDAPFFLWLHYWDPHDPWLRPGDEYLEGVPRGPDGEVQPGVELYAAEVHYLDAQFGRLIQGLKDRGLYESTIIVVTADHGEGLADGVERHDWWAHRMVYQEQIRVPLLVRAPGLPGGAVVHATVRTVDIAPSILDYAGLPPPEGVDGRSFRNLIDGLPDEPRIAYADQINGYDTNAKMVERKPEAAFLYMLLDGDWKLTYRPHMPGASELFNLADDPKELTNVFDPASEVVLRLLGDLARRDPWVLAPFPPDGGPTMTSTLASSLQGLGYAPGTVSAVDWEWACPKHPRFRANKRQKHEECGSILIPVAAD